MTFRVECRTIDTWHGVIERWHVIEQRKPFPDEEVYVADNEAGAQDFIMRRYQLRSDDHDLDVDRIDWISHEQGNYDNGWQLVSIWCRTHGCFEWSWIDYECVPESLRLRFHPKPSFGVIEGGKAAPF
jgi:hypothetical protein